jgi:hypothetical protein
VENSGGRGIDTSQQRQTSRRALSPKAVAPRWSRDDEQDCIVEDWRESIFESDRSRREDSRRAISCIA